MSCEIQVQNWSMKAQNEIYLGDQKLHTAANEVSGEEVKIGQESFYKIANYDEMRPFFMSIVSNSNHWMFISSTGSLSAGRKDSNNALFPYYTDDKITESSETTGSRTIFLVERNGKTFLWEPFSAKYAGVYAVSRNLYKNAYGNKIRFEEVNHDLGLTFHYEWNSSDTYGFVRHAHLENIGASEVAVRLLDGIQNILPSGIEEALQNASSNLVDAYKKCELEKDCNLGIYSLSAIIVDKAEPSEALKANVVWSLGMPEATRLLSSKQLATFRKGGELFEEIDIKAEKGAYFLENAFELSSGGSKSWMIVADINKSATDVAALKQELSSPEKLQSAVLEDIANGSSQLVQLVAASDGLQLTGDRLLNIRHFANTMFNIMRGGIFDDNYKIEKSDFVPYMRKANKNVFAAHQSVLEALPAEFDLNQLKSLGSDSSDLDFKRLCFEYLPLKFSRRHGDPSRPWNKFAINTRNEEDGSKILDYQGNWRDIFQNWEALAHSYPEFMEGMIHKFLNATTFDGYNPYRVTKDGFDWETIEPDNPWSYIGYWGDHQIIYLLKFLEFVEKHHPGTLGEYLASDLFVYANVPYHIKPYSAIVKDPKNTIDFDFKGEEAIQAKRAELGIDGALLENGKGEIHKVNFLEKILATVLAKMSNFIPEGGIWMNTQRPEWNDANNALVGNGVSMVTLFYLRRFLAFFEELLEGQNGNVAVSAEMLSFFNAVHSTLDQHKELIDGGISDAQRKAILDGLGEAASDYRWAIYENGFSGERETLAVEDVERFVALSKEFLEHSIVANQREDKLFHAYNLMTYDTEGVSISYLPEMLEGQVAVLSSGYLNAKQTLEVFDALKASALFREDQYSYILYPNKELARFVVKNTIPTPRAEASELIKTLIADGNRHVVTRDVKGHYHFNGTFNNLNSLYNALDTLDEQYLELAKVERDLLAQMFEEVFDHKSFTGRSGTFFGYEGLGSIYWHMVSKLQLAAYETTEQAIAEGSDPSLVGRMFDHYFEIMAGIGAHKSPKLYGAFPTDPYSHTPGGKGAQQPGMTGQVKEDLLSRFGELGVKVQGGQLSFEPNILRKEEFLSAPQTFRYFGLDKKEHDLPLDTGSLAFTYCQTPIVYTLGTAPSIAIHYQDRTEEIHGSTLSKEQTQELFARSGTIQRVHAVVVK